SSTAGDGDKFPHRLRGSSGRRQDRPGVCSGHKSGRRSGRSDERAYRMSSKRERPNSFAGLLNLSKPALPATEAPVVPADAAERAIGAGAAVPDAVPTPVL